MRPDRGRPLLVLGLVAAFGALAQDDDGPPVYSVEVLVFRNTAVQEPAYRWPGEPDLGAAKDLLPDEEPELPPLPPEAQAAPEGSADARPAADGDEPVAFGDAASGLASPPSRFDPTRPPAPLLPDEDPHGVVLMEPGTTRLDRALARLGNSPEYQPLAHLAWRQPASPFGEPLPIRVRSSERVSEPDDPPLFPGLDSTEQPLYSLDGTVALERGRFLHLRVDLVLRIPVNPSGLDSSIPTPLLAPGPSEGPEDYLVFRLRERRQVSRDSFNYFDHRHFGLIAVVGEWTPPEDEEHAGAGR